MLPVYFSASVVFGILDRPPPPTPIFLGGGGSGFVSFFLFLFLFSFSLFFYFCLFFLCVPSSSCLVIALDSCKMYGTCLMCLVLASVALLESEYTLCVYISTLRIWDFFFHNSVSSSIVTSIFVSGFFSQCDKLRLF